MKQEFIKIYRRLNNSGTDTPGGNFDGKDI